MTSQEDTADATPAPAGPNAHGVPDVSGVLRHLRAKQGMSLKALASASGLSASFLGSVERGESDIAVQRLARIAAVFGHDVGSLLGYTQRRAVPRIARMESQAARDRGPGVQLERLALPDFDFELVLVRFEPHSGFRDAVTHVGTDVCVVLDGELVVDYDGVDYPLTAGDCVTFPGSHPHAFRNDADVPARLMGIWNSPAAAGGPLPPLPPDDA
jgi:transcriptional regulator with XRE-family HTH domain